MLLRLISTLILCDASGINRDGGQTTVNTARPESAESVPPPHPTSTPARTTVRARKTLLITRLLITRSLLLNRARRIACLHRDGGAGGFGRVGLAGGDDV